MLFRSTPQPPFPTREGGLSHPQSPLPLRRERGYFATMVLRRLALAASLGAIAAACGIRVIDPSARVTPVPPASDDEVTRIDVQAAHTRWEGGSAVLIDTRGAEAFAVGHIRSAWLMPLADIDRDPAAARRTLPPGKLAIFYCT